MMRRFGWLFLLSFALWSCGTDEPESEPVSPTAPRLVGKVASLHASEGFVLIETYGDTVLGRDLLLTTQGEAGRSASLTVSGEHLGRFAAADIKAGDVKAGDAVYARPTLEVERDYTPTPEASIPPLPTPDR
ncbi:hypothetical protein [Haloferula sargassicola]|uniref:Uncharacterized protein n=1 Tax=Haloferula sargassicola TaxID=490096 RepID=A0ABP9UMC6_9BACT